MVVVEFDKNNRNIVVSKIRGLRLNCGLSGSVIIIGINFCIGKGSVMIMKNYFGIN